MSAFIMADVEVEDMAAYQQSGYLEAVPVIAARYGGRYRARGGELVRLEGDWLPKRMIIIEFPDMQKLRAFYESEEYRPWREVRHRLATSSIVAVDGLAEELEISG